jgi:AraC-like DNA-binding protein
MPNLNPESGMAEAGQGTMTSPALMAMLKRAVSAACPGLDVAGLDKVGLLRAVLEAQGWGSVVALGGRVRDLAGHPILRAVASSPDPVQVLRRWMRLERFGHSRNRTALLAASAEGGECSLTLRHVAIDGGAIAAVDDLYIWGLVIGLVEAAGASDIRAILIQDGADPFALWGPDVVAGCAPLPIATDTLLLRARVAGKPGPTVVSPADGNADSTRTALATLLDRDLLEQWTVAAAARDLGMSPRSLQRFLNREGTTFSEVVLRARVRRAHCLLEETNLSLTEIAYCTGFADQAHFTRVFRRISDVPPSALRDILAART